MPAASKHTRHHLILVYQPSSFAPVKTTRYCHSGMLSPEEYSFHSVRRQRICIKIYSLLPATRLSYHSLNGLQQPLNLADVCV